MPHVFQVANRIHVHRLRRRRTVIRLQDVSMSGEGAVMARAKAAPAETARSEAAVVN